MALDKYVYLRKLRALEEAFPKRPIVCCDLDGTLRYNVQRRHLLPSLNRDSTWADYAGAAGGDELIPGPAKVLELLHSGHEIHLVSSADHTSYVVTAEWLADKGVCYDHLELTNHTELGHLSDVERKLAYVQALQDAGYEVVLFIDNYAPITRAMNDHGVPGMLVDPDYPPLGPDGLPVEV